MIFFLCSSLSFHNIDAFIANDLHPVPDDLDSVVADYLDSIIADYLDSIIADYLDSVAFDYVYPISSDYRQSDFYTLQNRGDAIVNADVDGACFGRPLSLPGQKEKVNAYETNQSPLLTCKTVMRAPVAREAFDVAEMEYKGKMSLI
ncbi:hypothetical protein EVAR_43920_1 [Eumeta japonica]|uniref:Uncharacterized protein n=1 Tax=Eumeta variegata TaxID=151549 RepID=A0A4C1WQW1_EUMVA|nr:hypothetical protein EVAR_43920_1 [Eumeta japonica]